jgi:hypothetical protein
MSDLGTPKTAIILTSTALGASTSSNYPLARGPLSFQASVIAISTGTTGILATTVLNVSNDNLTYFALSTALGTGTIAVVGTNTGANALGTSSINSLGIIGTNAAVRFANVTVTTTGAAAGTNNIVTGSITQ